MNKLTLSLAPRTLDARNAYQFRSETIDLDKMEEVVKSYNYSLISWKTDNNSHYRHRKIENFESASGIVIDIDDGMTIDDAEKRLQKSWSELYNYYIKVPPET